ncbi:MAG TPA: peptidylprolyl isomerase, partial [Polyangiales bacterium]
MATFDELDRVVLWVSRIVVLHDHSQLDGGIPSPTQLTWDVSRPPPKRSRTEALKIAQTAAAEAARDPDHFDQLALRYSDDPLTRERGASLGGVRASQFSASFLDALQAVGRGNTTGVIETSLGFYVLSWRLPPRPEQLAGRHVLIPYLPSTGNTPWAPTRRTREEALVIAQQALAAPRPFTALVQHYSEAADRERDGDMG